MPLTLTKRTLLKALGLAPVLPLLAVVKAEALPASAQHLMDFAIAGGHYYGLPAHRTVLRIGAELVLRAEPENRYDEQAVVVETLDGVKLGYVPRSANRELAAWLADGGEARARAASHLDGMRADNLRDLAFTSFTQGDPRVSVFLIG